MTISSDTKISQVNKIEHYIIDSKIKENSDLKKTVDFYLSNWKNSDAVYMFYLKLKISQ